MPKDKLSVGGVRVWGYILIIILGVLSLTSCSNGGGSEASPQEKNKTDDKVSGELKNVCTDAQKISGICLFTLKIGDTELNRCIQEYASAEEHGWHLVSHMTHLECSSKNYNIQSLTGISALTSLSSVNFNGLGSPSGNLVDVDELSKLKNLTSLSLSGHKVNNISQLGTLETLSSLDLSNNNLSNIEPLLSLSALKNVDLSNNRDIPCNTIDDLDAVVDKLVKPGQCVDFSSFKVKDSELNRCISEVVNNQNLVDITELTGLWCPYVEYAVEDLDGIEQLESLEYLNVEAFLPLESDDVIEVKNLSKLSRLKNLSTLDISGRNLSDISDILILSSLKSLDVGCNLLDPNQDWSALSNLKTLNIELNSLKNINFLQDITQLEELNIASNEIASLDVVAGLDGLKKLNVSNNILSSLEPLYGSTYLHDLDLTKNPLPCEEPAWLESELPQSGVLIKKHTCSNSDDYDYDSDGVDNFTDNCSADINPTQLDIDQNGIGDACDHCNNISQIVGNKRFQHLAATTPSPNLSTLFESQFVRLLIGIDENNRFWQKLNDNDWQLLYEIEGEVLDLAATQDQAILLRPNNKLEAIPYFHPGMAQGLFDEDAQSALLDAFFSLERGEAISFGSEFDLEGEVQGNVIAITIQQAEGQQEDRVYVLTDDSVIWTLSLDEGEEYKTTQFKKADLKIDDIFFVGATLYGISYEDKILIDLSTPEFEEYEFNDRDIYDVTSVESQIYLSTNQGVEALQFCDYPFSRPDTHSLLSSAGTFEKGVEQFAIYTPDESNTVSVVDGVLNLLITSLPEESYEVQINHEFNLEKNVRYTLCFEALAVSERDIHVIVDGGPLFGFEPMIEDGKILFLTEDMQNYSYTFYSDTSNERARVVFNMGQSDIDVTLDNIGLFYGSKCPGQQ